MPRGITQDQNEKQILARNLQQAMVEKGISSQSELGRLTGIARHNISLYLSAKSAPTSINLAKIARILGIDPLELLSSEPPMISKGSQSRNTEATLGQDGICLKINRTVSWDVGMKILHLLDEDRKCVSELTG